MDKDFLCFIYHYLTEYRWLSKENLLSMNINKDVEKIKNLLKTPSNNRSYVLSNHKETDISYAFKVYF